MTVQAHNPHSGANTRGLQGWARCGLQREPLSQNSKRNRTENVEFCQTFFFFHLKIIEVLSSCKSSNYTDYFTEVIVSGTDIEAGTPNSWHAAYPPWRLYPHALFTFALRLRLSVGPRLALSLRLFSPQPPKLVLKVLCQQARFWFWNLRPMIGFWDNLL